MVIRACSLPHSQVAAACQYPEPDSCSPCLLIPPLGDPFCCYPPIYVKIFQVVSFAPVSQPKDCTHISCLPYMSHAPPIRFLIYICWGVQIMNLTPRSTLTFFLL